MAVNSPFEPADQTKPIPVLFAGCAYNLTVTSETQCWWRWGKYCSKVQTTMLVAKITTT